LGDEKSRNDWLALAGFIVIVILISVVMLETGIPATSGWSASNTTPVDVVIGSTTWVTTNQYGVTATYSTVYTTTASSTSGTTTTSPATPWLRLTLHGTYQITDASGAVVYVQTFEWAPIGGSGNGTHTKYDVTYEVEGEGVDWSTLSVNVNVNGVAVQPKVDDPSNVDVINTLPNIESVSGVKTKSGHMGKLVPIDNFVGGKAFDKKRILSTSIAATGVATAKVAPGYSLAGGSQLEIDVGPVSGISNMEWKDPASPPTPVPPPTPTYTQNVAKKNKEAYCDIHNCKKDKDGGGSKPPAGYEPKKSHMEGIFAFLGIFHFSQPITILGADEITGIIDDTTVGILLVITISLSVFIIIVVGKKKSH
jgi:hypothetical protein